MIPVPELVEIKEELIQLESSLDYLKIVGDMKEDEVDLKGEMRAIRITRQNRVREIKDMVDKLIKRGIYNED